MDNLTHSLAGWALAGAGFDRRTAPAAGTLVLGANLPDVDALIYLVGSNTDALAFRRGWTHGVLAMVVLPVLLTAGVLAWDRLVRRLSGKDRPPVVVGWLLIVATIGVWSHPLLDWLNTYGVRVLMPFSGQWFYGDALFIVDPWVWLVLGAGIFGSRRRGPGPARIALLAVALYAAGMATSSRVGRAAVERQATGTAALRVLVAPVFANPARREVIRDLGSSYEEGVLRWTPAPGYRPLARRETGTALPGVPEAVGTPSGANFMRWSRFPLAVTQPAGDSLLVQLSDMRYGAGPSASWATTSLRVRP